MSSSAPRAWWSRRSAAASSQARTARLVESRRDAERSDEATHVEWSGGGRRGADLDRRQPDRHRDLAAGLQGGPARRLMAAEPNQGATGGRPMGESPLQADSAEADPFAERPEAF